MACILDDYLQEIYITKMWAGFVIIDKDKLRQLLYDTPLKGEYTHPNSEIEEFMRNELNKPEHRFEVNKSYAEHILDMKFDDLK